MKRIMATAALSAVGVLALAGTASADIGDIDEFVSDGDPSGTATAAQISGSIVCTTTIEYGLVVKVAQNEPDGAFAQGGGNDSDTEGVGAFGPSQGNEANSPCSTSNQNWEVVVQNNRDSDPYQDDTLMGIFSLAGTSAENGDRGPGPFIGDSAYRTDTARYERTDP